MNHIIRYLFVLLFCSTFNSVLSNESLLNVEDYGIEHNSVKVRISSIYKFKNQVTIYFEIEALTDIKQLVVYDNNTYLKTVNIFDYKIFDYNGRPYIYEGDYINTGEKCQFSISYYYKTYTSIEFEQIELYNLGFWIHDKETFNYERKIFFESFNARTLPSKIDNNNTTIKSSNNESYPDKIENTEKKETIQTKLNNKKSKKPLKK